MKNKKRNIPPARQNHSRLNFSFSVWNVHSRLKISIPSLGFLRPERGPEWKKTFSIEYFSFRIESLIFFNIASRDWIFWILGPSGMGVGSHGGGFPIWTCPSFSLGDKRAVFVKGWFWRMYPRSGFRSRGTRERTLVPVFVPGEHPNVPSFRFLFRGNIRQNHPFGKPPLILGKSPTFFVLFLSLFLSLFGGLSRCFQEFSRLVLFLLFGLSTWCKSTYEEQSRKCPRHNPDLSPVAAKRLK